MSTSGVSFAVYAAWPGGSGDVGEARPARTISAPDTSRERLDYSSLDPLPDRAWDAMRLLELSVAGHDGGVGRGIELARRSKGEKRSDTSTGMIQGPRIREVAETLQFGRPEPTPVPHRGVVRVLRMGRPVLPHEAQWSEYHNDSIGVLQTIQHVVRGGS